VVAGDFNVCPTDLDVYDPAVFADETHVTEPERERFAALLETGMVDAFRALHPDEPGFTWWDYRQGHSTAGWASGSTPRCCLGRSPSGCARAGSIAASAKVRNPRIMPHF
jgi:hypothetical protein